MAEASDDRAIQEIGNGRKTGRVPEWSQDPYSDFLDHTELLSQVLHLTIHGISLLVGMPEILEKAEEFKRVAGESVTESRVESARKEAELARREVESGFSIVHSQMVVALWSSMEALVHGFVRQWLINRPESILQEPWRNLKVKIGDWEGLDQELKSQYLVDALEQNLGSHLKQGINRFEAVFAALGLAGSVEDHVKEAIFEMQQVRNVIVHKRGTADHRFCSACPWLNQEPGQRLLVSHEMAYKYFKAVHEYAIELMCRNAEFFGVTDIRDSAPKL
jgi:hypothetical protein